MTEHELIDQLTNKVAEVMADTDVRLGWWKHITSPAAGEDSRQYLRFYLRMSVAALSVLAPMVVERDAQIDTLRKKIAGGGGPDEA